MITVESKVIVGQIRGLRVILSSLVLEELGKRLFRISHFLIFRAHKINSLGTLLLQVGISSITE